MHDPTPLAGPIAVTIAYLVLYYAFMIHQTRVKYGLAQAARDRGEKFDRYFGNDREMLAADRILLNTLEHMPAFLVLLWLNAVFVGPTSASIAGGIYVGARAAYPLLMGRSLGRAIPVRIFASTLAGYLVIAWYVVALVWVLVVPG
jgi:uncharacterized membrane protein YecN with MAPEG domain